MSKFPFDHNFPFIFVQHIQKAVDGAASAEGITKVDNELSALKHQVAGELIGARYVYMIRVFNFSFHSLETNTCQREGILELVINCLVHCLFLR